jgi:hypothetical protein
MKMHGGVFVQIHAFFCTVALVGSKWSASRPSSFTPWERAPGTHWIGGWVGPQVGLDKGKWKCLTLPGLEQQPLDQSAASNYTDYATEALI